MYRYKLWWQVLRRSVVGLTRDGLEMTAEVTPLYQVIPRLAAELHQ